MNNNDFNKRVLEKLENKIAIEQYKEEGFEKVKKKRFRGMKVASFVMVTGLLLGNITTYAMCGEDLFTWSRNLLNKIGITEEYEKNKISTNLEYDYNGVKLNIIDYGIDKENLVIGYKLKFNDKTKIADTTTPLTILENGNEKIEISENYNTIIEPVNDTEYMIYEIYKVNGEEIKEGTILKEEFKLYNQIFDIDDVLLAKFDVEIPLSLEKRNTDSKVFDLNEKVVKLETVKNPYYGKNKAFIPEFILRKLKVSEIATKLVFDIENRGTEPNLYFTMEVLNKNNEKLLIKDSEFFVGDEVVFKKVDMDDELTINFYEECKNENDEMVILSQGTTKIKLTDLIEYKENKKIEKVQWNELSFDYIYETSNELNSFYDTFDVNYYDHNNYTSVNVQKDNKSIGFVSLLRYDNKGKFDIKSLIEKMKLAEYAGGYGFDENEYVIYKVNDDGEIVNEYKLTNKEFFQYAKNGKIDIKGEKLKLSDEHKHDVKYSNEKYYKIDGNDVYSCTKLYGQYSNEYVIMTEKNIYRLIFSSSQEMKKYENVFMNSLKIKK